MLPGLLAISPSLLCLSTQDRVGLLQVFFVRPLFSRNALSVVVPNARLSLVSYTQFVLYQRRTAQFDSIDLGAYAVYQQ